MNLNNDYKIAITFKMVGILDSRNLNLKTSNGHNYDGVVPKKHQRRW